jgi:predicted ATPase
LLSASEQLVFRRLGVFVGGFTLELAAEVAKDDAHDEAWVVELLAALVDRSLVDGYQYLKELLVALPRARTVDDYEALLPWRLMSKRT